jgi:hypothetical protein
LTPVTEAVRLDRKRIDVYLAQTGRKLLTPRQRRRIAHKANHALFGERADR